MMQLFQVAFSYWKVSLIVAVILIGAAIYGYKIHQAEQAGAQKEREATEKAAKSRDKTADTAEEAVRACIARRDRGERVEWNREKKSCVSQH